MRVAAVLVVVAALAAPASAQAPMSFRVTGVAWDLGTSAECPDGSVRYAIERGSSHRHVGTATMCVVEGTKRDLAGGVVVVTERVVETDAFANGWLRTRSFQVYRSAADGKSATISIRGDVTGGTGVFAHRRGTLTGSGTRVGDRIDVRIVVRWR